MHPDQLLEQLKSTAGTRKARGLNIVNDICRKQFEQGKRDFSLATIGKLSTENGGPTTQSIRNTTGSDYKALISAWANYTGGSVKRESKPPNNPLFAVLEKIPDPAVRAVVGTVLAENTKLKGEVNLLKRNAQVVIDQRPLTVASGGGQTVQTLPACNGLTETEKEALRHATSERLLEDEGWHTDDSGRVLNSRGRVIFKAGFVTAIRKVVGE